MNILLLKDIKEIYCGLTPITEVLFRGVKVWEKDPGPGPEPETPNYFWMANNPIDGITDEPLKIYCPDRFLDDIDSTLEFSYDKDTWRRDWAEETTGGTETIITENDTIANLRQKYPNTFVAFRGPSAFAKSTVVKIQLDDTTESFCDITKESSYIYAGILLPKDISEYFTTGFNLTTFDRNGSIVGTIKVSGSHLQTYYNTPTNLAINISLTASSGMITSSATNNKIVNLSFTGVEPEVTKYYVTSEPEQKVYFRMVQNEHLGNVGYFTTNNRYFNVGGNIHSLIRYQVMDTVQNSYDYQFQNYYKGNLYIVDAGELIFPYTEMGYYCCHSMFLHCDNLIKAPVLYAKKLGSGSYYMMFQSCPITEIKLYAEEISEGVSPFQQWLSSVPVSGTFYNYGHLELERGVSGIPEGWTVVTE